MHVPSHFAADDAQVDALLRPGLAQLVTATPSGLLCTPVPVVRVGGSLLGHLARSNPQWREPVLGEAMALLQGPQGYVSPSWYATKQEHGRVVPTWNYVTAHVYGELVVHDDVAFVDDVVRRLTAAFETDRPDPWAVDDAPAAFVHGQLRAIVGFELVVTQVVAKAKLSQNRRADVAGVVAGLRSDGEYSLADAVEQARPQDR